MILDHILSDLQHLCLRGEADVVALHVLHLGRKEGHGGKVPEVLDEDALDQLQVSDHEHGLRQVKGDAVSGKILTVYNS